MSVREYVADINCNCRTCSVYCTPNICRDGMLCDFSKNKTFMHVLFCRLCILVCATFSHLHVWLNTPFTAYIEYVCYTHVEPVCSLCDAMMLMLMMMIMMMMVNRVCGDRVGVSTRLAGCSSQAQGCAVVIYVYTICPYALSADSVLPSPGEDRERVYSCNRNCMRLFVRESEWAHRKCSNDCVCMFWCSG